MTVIRQVDGIRSCCLGRLREHTPAIQHPRGREGICQESKARQWVKPTEITPKGELNLVWESSYQRVQSGFWVLLVTENKMIIF